MSEILGFFKKDRMSGLMVTQSLNRAVKNKTPVLLEIENTYVSFKTVFTMKDNLLVVAKPMGVNQHLNKGTMIRMSFADLPGKSLKVEVSIPQLNLASGASVFVAKVVNNATVKGREHLRFDTTRIVGMELDVAGRGAYKVVDVSNTGLRFIVPLGDISQAFPLGRSIQGKLMVKKHPVELVNLVPKTHKSRTVGCTMLVAPQSIPVFQKVLRLIEANHEQTIMGKLGAEGVTK